MIGLVLLLANAVALGILVGVGWVLPDLLPPTVRMGVRVPLEHRDDPGVIAATRQYRIGWSIASAIGGTLLVWGLFGPSAAAVIAAPFVAACGSMVAYVAARRRLLQHKSGSGWSAEGPKSRYAAIESPARLVQLAVWWVPAVVIWAATLFAGIVLYPTLPSVLATHYNAAGMPDSWSSKSPATVFGLTIVGAGVLVVLTALAIAVFRSKPYLDVSSPHLDARRQAVFRERMARGLLGLGACLQASLGLAAALVWGLGPAGEAGVLLPLAPLLVGAVGLVLVAVRSGQLGSRIGGEGLPPAAREEVTVPYPAMDDDAYWRAGLFYVNRSDPAVLVPKRFGVGWTLNLGNPWSWLILSLPLGLITVALLLTAHVA